MEGSGVCPLNVFAPLAPLRCLVETEIGLSKMLASWLPFLPAIDVRLREAPDVKSHPARPDYDRRGPHGSRLARLPTTSDLRGPRRGARRRRRILAHSPVLSSGGKRRDPWAARLLGAATSGLLELVIFHPLDTVAKRLMSSRVDAKTMNDYSRIVFREAAGGSPLQRLTSLVPGFSYAAGYKIMQRTYKFGAQGSLKDYFQTHHVDAFEGAFGKKQGTNMMHAFAGSLVGIGEVAIMPLDGLKIKAQTNPEVLGGRGLVDLLRSEGPALYRGWEWTVMRNAPGSFALFGGAAVVKGSVFGLDDYGQATLFQNFIASIAGAVAAITCSSPMDVIKTRVQTQGFRASEHTPGRALLRDLLRVEGAKALFKGLTPKILVVGPKLTFSFTVAQTLTSSLGAMMREREEEEREEETR